LVKDVGDENVGIWLIGDITLYWVLLLGIVKHICIYTHIHYTSPYLIKHMTGIPLDAFTSLRNGLDNSGLTPLHVAAFRGDDAVAWLEPQL